VLKKEAREIGESKSLKVTGDVIEEFMKNQSTVVKSNHYLKADNIVIEGLSNVTVKVGQSYIAIEAGGIKIGTTGNIELESTGDTKIKATGNFKAEATANAEIKGTAGAKLESTAMCDVKGLQASLKGDAMVTVKGGVTMVG
jgi:type VI secretion system secreted protein VgrG